tara:strand:+ start:48 stop:548 length:501 start_codon:yes stop_codon:yes gene_type:complete
MIRYDLTTDTSEWLPQKEPFKFIDKVVSMKFPLMWKKRIDITPQDLVGSEIICKFFVDEKLGFFEGHFPENPILPGVIQIEMMAQATSFTMRRLWSYKEFKKRKIALVGIENMRFKKPVFPNETLTIHTKYVKFRYPLGIFDCKIENQQGDVVAKGTIKSTMIEGD